ncbi:mRNA interferase [Escherichia coli]
MKQSELRRWLESQGVDVANGSNHLKLRFHGNAQCHAASPLRKAILKQLGWF